MNDRFDHRRHHRRLAPADGHGRLSEPAACWPRSTPAAPRSSPCRSAASASTAMRGAWSSAGRPVSPAAQHGRLRHRARRGADRGTGARGARHQLGEAGADRRPRDALSRMSSNCCAARPNWSTRASPCFPTPTTTRSPRASWPMSAALRSCRWAALIGSGNGHREPPRDRAHLQPARPCRSSSTPASAPHRTRPGAGARLQRGAAQYRRRQGQRPGAPWPRAAPRGRGRPPRPCRRPHPETRFRRGVQPAVGADRPGPVISTWSSLSRHSMEIAAVHLHRRLAVGQSRGGWRPPGPRRRRCRRPWSRRRRAPRPAGGCGRAP
jgi:hypothetical protein